MVRWLNEPSQLMDDVDEEGRRKREGGERIYAG